jgi:hypothetical protein
MQAEAAQVEASRKEVDLARQAYKPGWMLELTYGQRVGEDPEGDSRSDMLSAMVSVDLPLFRDKRQTDARFHAGPGRRVCTRDRLRELRTALDVEYGNWERLGECLNCTG